MSISVLKDGCYYLRFTPKDPDPEVPFYEGTMRVLHVDASGESTPNEGEIKAGGDLYIHPRTLPEYDPANKGPKAKWIEPPQGKVVPIFPRKNYRYYLDITKVLKGNDPENKDFTARFRVNTFDSQTSWPVPGVRTIAMTRVDPPKGSKYPPADGEGTRPLYFKGTVLNQDNGEEVGTVTMGWVSEHLRRAWIIVDQVDGVQGPLNTEEWQKAFKEVGWHVEIFPRTAEVTGLRSAAGQWTIGELHHAMLQAKAQLKGINEQPNKLQANQKITINLKKALGPSDTSSDFDALLDEQWSFHLLCVKAIDGFERGVMYDVGAGDSNHIPREGAAIACGWPFPQEPQWGEPGKYGQKLQDVNDVCFRVAVHEIGHAMGLDHNFKDFGFMCTTDTIADRGFEEYAKLSAKADAAAQKANIARTVANLAKGQPAGNLLAASAAAQPNPNPKETAVDLAEQEAEAARIAGDKFKADASQAIFARNVRLHFHVDDRKRLRFAADVTVRPGTSFEQGGPLFDDSNPIPEPALELKVMPHLDAVPLGAPVRVNLRLTNISDDEMFVPETIDFNSGLISGKVIDPNGRERSFWPLKKCFDKEPKVQLKATGSVMGSLTLWRGAQGALFPVPGRHRIVVKLTWNKNGQRVSREESAEVSITPAANDAHNVTALKVLSTPDLLLSIAVGGSHLKEGNHAVKTAMRNEVLKPHYMMMDYKLTNLTKSLDKACALLDSSAVLSFSEIHKITAQLQKHKNGPPAAQLTPRMKRAVKLLVEKVAQLSVYAGADVQSCLTLKDQLEKLP